MLSRWLNVLFFSMTLVLTAQANASPCSQLFESQKKEANALVRAFKSILKWVTLESPKVPSEGLNEFGNERVGVYSPLVNGKRASGKLIQITGSDFHPLEHTLEALNLTVAEIKKLKDKNVLSLGEGYSDLLPYLLSESANAFGLDVWYHTENIPNNATGRLMKDYVSKYGDRLIRGDVLQTLEEASMSGFHGAESLKKEAFDSILSFQLVNNFDRFSDKITVLDLSIALLKNGGEARIFGFSPREAAELQRYQRIAYGDQIELKTTPLAIPYKTSEGYSMRLTNVLVTITKRVNEAERLEYQPGPIPPKPSNAPRITM